MADYDNTNRGVLFKNDRKDSDRHPDYRGSIDVGGTEFWLSAWIKEGQKGKFMSLSVQPKEQQSRPAPVESGQSGGGFSDADHDIPFNRHHGGRAWARFQ